MSVLAANPASVGDPPPVGVRVVELVRHLDDRGAFAELYREEWDLGRRPLQWNIAQSAANVLRGVHAHRAHTDYLTVAAGEMVIALHDLRRGSPTFGQATVLTITAEAPKLVVIPPGVAHGFYFRAPTIHVYGVSRYWDPDDELGCRWDDPDLRLAWPCADPLLSARDRSAGSLAELRAAFNDAPAA